MSTGWQNSVAQHWHGVCNIWICRCSNSETNSPISVALLCTYKVTLQWGLNVFSGNFLWHHLEALPLLPIRYAVALVCGTGKSSIGQDAEHKWSVSVQKEETFSAPFQFSPAWAHSKCCLCLQVCFLYLWHRALTQPAWFVWGHSTYFLIKR